MFETLSLTLWGKHNFWCNSTCFTGNIYGLKQKDGNWNGRKQHGRSSL